jgi:hypothetical protein
MILPTGTTVAVADGETVRLFHTGVKPGVHGRNHGGSACARPLRLGCAPSHRLCQPRWQAARRGRLRGSYGRVPERAQPRRDHKAPGRCLRPQDPGGDAQALPPRPERQDHRRVREGLQPASARGHRLIDRRRLTRLMRPRDRPILMLLLVGGLATSERRTVEPSLDTKVAKKSGFFRSCIARKSAGLVELAPP